MEHDHYHSGKVLHRRNVLKLLSAAGISSLSPFAKGAIGKSVGTKTFRSEFSAESTTIKLPPCIARLEMIEGPYFIDSGLN
jgi:hypothetical protein